MLHRLATAYRTVFAKIDLTASDQHAGFALAAALQARSRPPAAALLPPCGRSKAGRWLTRKQSA